MHAAVRAKLQRSVDFHNSLVDYHKKKQEAEGEQPVGETNGSVATEGSVEGEQPQESGSVTSAPKESQAAKLVKLHSEVAKQLQDLLDADPDIVPVERPDVRRNTGPLRMVRGRLQ